MDRPERLGASMGRALRGLDLDLRMREARAMALWPDVVGEVTATKTRPLHVNRGTMVVAVASSAWANQLNFMKPQLLAALEARCGAGVIRDLRWKTGLDLALPAAPQPGTPPDGAARRQRASEPALSPEHERANARLVEPIGDAELAGAVRRALDAQVRRRERLRAKGWSPCDRCGVLHDPLDARRLLAAHAEPGAAILCPVCWLEARSALPHAPG